MAKKAGGTEVVATPTIEMSPEEERAKACPIMGKGVMLLGIYGQIGQIQVLRIHWDHQGYVLIRF